MRTARSASMSSARHASSSNPAPPMAMHRHDTPARDSVLTRIGSCYLHGLGVEMRNVAMKPAGWFRISVVLMLAWLALAIPAGAQKNKNKKNDTPDGNSLANPIPLPSPPDTQAIDQAISEMMGYWQIGDVD